MDKTWKQLLAAAILSLLLPQAILSLGSRLAGQTQQEVTEPATAASSPTVRPPLPLRIEVLLPDGSVEQMLLEDYIRGVVLAEMPASFGVEALKAQAIAARTYALRRRELQDRHTQGAICTESTCCQAWLSDEDYLDLRGTRAEWAKIAGAVEMTRSLVLTYDGRLAEATYFSCSGGRTEDALAVWGAQIPYLQAVDSPGEEQASGYEQTLYFTAAQFSDALGRTLTGPTGQWLGAVSYTSGGGVATCVIGGISYSGTQLRKALSLNSTSFTLTADGDGITVVTYGKGHRVGLSQYGANAMAKNGSTCFEILAHYYRGTEIDKYSDVG